MGLEYVMMEGVNDGEEDAERLAAMTEGMDCVVNLIGFNTHEGRMGEGRREGGREGGGWSSFVESLSVTATEGGGDMRQVLMCDFCISHLPFLPPSLPPSLPPGAVFLPSSKEKIMAFRSILKKDGRTDEVSLCVLVKRLWWGPSAGHPFQFRGTLLPCWPVSHSAPPPPHHHR